IWERLRGLKREPFQLIQVCEHQQRFKAGYQRTKRAMHLTPKGREVTGATCAYPSKEWLHQLTESQVMADFELGSGPTIELIDMPRAVFEKVDYGDKPKDVEPDGWARVFSYFNEDTYRFVLLEVDCNNENLTSGAGKRRNDIENKFRG